MPSKITKFIKARKYKKKQAYRRKRNYRQSRFGRITKHGQTLLRNPSKLIPDRYFTKLHYETELYTSDLSSAVSNFSAIFRANSLYDPEYELGGGQPSGFDFFKQIYKYYKVHKSKISAKAFTSNSDQTMNGYTATIMALDDAVAPAINDVHSDTVYGRKNARSKDLKIFTSNRPQDGIISYTKLTKAVKGLSDIRSPVFNTPCDSNPVTTTHPEQHPGWYWVFTLWNPRYGTTPTAPAYIRFRMTYWVEFNHPLALRDIVLHGDPTESLDALNQESATGIQHFYQPAFAGTGMQNIFDDS